MRIGRKTDKGFVIHYRVGNMWLKTPRLWTEEELYAANIEEVATGGLKYAS